MGKTSKVLWCVLALAVVLSVGTAASPGADPSRAEPDPERPSTVVVRVQDGGFHWTDAGIGAAAALATTLLALGLVLALRPNGGEEPGITRRSSERERS
jgi:hypothetical protein